MRRPVSLRTRILAWYSATVLGVLGLVFSLVHLWVHWETGRHLTLQMATTQRVMEHLQNERTTTLAIVARLAGEEPRLASAMTSHDAATIGDLVRQDLRRSLEADFVRITDVHGRALTDTSGRVRPLTDLSHEGGVRTAMSGKIWSGMLFLPGEIYLAASAPIRVGGEELGTITVGRQVDEDLSRELCRETGSQVTFFAGARLAATSWPARARPELLQTLRPTLAAPAPPAGSQSPSAAAGGTLRFAMQLGGQQFIGLLIPLRSQERTTGYLLIQSSLDEALRPYIHFQRALDGVGLMGLLVAILGSVIVAGGVTRPLQRIARAADGLMQGDWSQRTPVTSRDEVGLLAETFNLMAERLESWDSDLRAAVADRTRDLNAAVARSEMAYQQLRRFNADASHELRTPLTVIRGEAEVALRAARRPEEYRAVLRGIQEETERMSRIIEQLLLLARADSGELRLERRPLALDDLVREVAHRAQVLAGARRIRLLTPELAPTLLEGDEDHLHQLVLNLIDNAIKYTPEGGEVRVRLTAAPERAGPSAREAVLAVEDSGIGIAAADLPHLFDRFYRVDKARNRAQGSCGLGLAICHWIVAAHGGRIEVRSDPGAGSTFSVWLPGAIVPAASEQWEGAAAD